MGEEESTELRQCGKGHRPSAVMETAEGGSICLVCFCNLASDPVAPSHHVSYALSQLSRAMTGGGTFVWELRAVHGHLLVLPLVHVLSSFDDEPLARQAIDLVSDICSGEFESPESSVYSACESLTRDFIVRMSDRLSSGALAWSRRQVFMLHCFGLLLDRGQAWNLSDCIRNKADLVLNLVSGLQLPSEEIRGEILFVLYKLFTVDDHQYDDGYDEEESLAGSRMMRLSLDVLIKTQSDDVRTNCIALLTVLVQKGGIKETPGRISCRRRAEFTQSELDSEAPLVNLFADAIKAPLLSSDTKVQIGALDLIFYSLSMELYGAADIEILIEENIADYVLEILRLSGNNDPLIIPCLRVLELLTSAEENLRKRLAVGFATLLSVLRYVADIPLHPVQYQAMKLVWVCISNCPGVISISQIEELTVTLTDMFARYSGGEFGMLPETFILGCLTFVESLKSPSSHQIKRLEILVKEMLKNIILSSLSIHRASDQPLLYSLYLIKEAILYSEKERSLTSSSSEEVMNCITEICETSLLSWLGKSLEEGQDEDAVMEVLEIFHLLLLQESDVRKRKFSESLASSSWTTWSFGCLALNPSDKMKFRIYLLLSSVFDCIFGRDFGESIRNACTNLPSDPVELLFLLGQSNVRDSHLLTSQSAVITILYCSTIFEERIADEDQVLASLEQYILVNGNTFSLRILTQLIHLYSFIRGVLSSSSLLYSEEAERILFRFISDSDWDLLSMSIHPTALKWLLQQNGIIDTISRQILDFCRSYDMNMNQLNKQGMIIRMVDMHMLSDMILSGDNYLVSIFILLLQRLDGEYQQDDLSCLMDVVLAILNLFPKTSKQFCLNKVSDAIRSLCYSHPPGEVFTTLLLLAFNVLSSAPSEVLYEDAAWLPITVKLLERVNSLLAEDSCSPDTRLIIGFLCLVLNHSTCQALGEAAKSIVLDTTLISIVDQKVKVACSKGPGLVNHDEESLLLILLLYFFSLKSLGALLQETVVWEDFILAVDWSTETSVIKISCIDLCRLLYYGTHAVKLVSSQCLLELLTRVSPDWLVPHDQSSQVRSMLTVTEGLVFYEDTRVAMSCGLCSSIILGWDNHKSTVNVKWSRLIMEELTLLLVAPGLASESFKAQHKPMAHIAKALLASTQLPEWVKSLFCPSCISGIIKSLSPNNVTPEIVELFRYLSQGRLVDEEQASTLRQIFQACRKQIYKNSSHKKSKEEFPAHILIASSEEASTLCSFLTQLMLSSGHHLASSRLLSEIDQFFQVIESNPSVPT